MARKTAALVRDPKAKAERQVVMSRIFARETARIVGTNAMNIVLGAGALDEASVAGFREKVSMDALIYNQAGLMTDMDRAADIIFGR